MLRLRPHFLFVGFFINQHFLNRQSDKIPVIHLNETSWYCVTFASGHFDKLQVTKVQVLFCNNIYEEFDKLSKWSRTNVFQIDIYR